MKIKNGTVQGMARRSVKVVKRNDLEYRPNELVVYETVPEFKFALREDLKDHPEFFPTKATDTDTGYDVRCASIDGVVLKPFETTLIPLGFRTFCPQNYWFKLVPRSSAFIKKKLNCLYGVIDEAFPLEAMFVCKFFPDHPDTIVVNDGNMKIDFGERIGQIIPVRRQDMITTAISNEEIDKLYAERNASRDGGFGSSGNK
jgi:dUTPase